ncbi:unannotated protein [freshwater metagenome]|uniref:Unannotated protein n=1 Tax=freshwater metagenome TaxID=449393 RepID=A0A6J7DIC9_9ZZZZ|nr:hypothetical protein [Actinomycetota bacterium]
MPDVDTPEVRPTRVAQARGLLLTFALAATVSAFGALFAHFFRESILFTLEHLGGDRRSTVVAADSSRLGVFALVTAGLLAAGWIGRIAMRWGHERLGLAAVAVAARGAGAGPSMSGTLLRSSGTWLAMSTLSSLGREAAILETGGSFGAWLGRRMHRPPADLASTGIAAAFAAAYHAPIGAFLYVREHVVNRPERRTIACSLAGGVMGFLFSLQFLGGAPVFHHGVDPLGGGAFVRAAAALIPAVIVTRAFFAVRKRLAPSVEPAPESARIWLRSAVFAVVGGAVVALVPLTSGNGMEAIRQGFTGATVGLGLALCFGKLVATSASIGSGAPGGVFSPSMAVAAGAALLSFEALAKLGVTLPGTPWDGMLAAMSVGIAVGTRSPLVGIVVVAELAGDARLLPVCGVAVGLAWLVERIIDAASRRLRPERAVVASLDG